MAITDSAFISSRPMGGDDTSERRWSQIRYRRKSMQKKSHIAVMGTDHSAPANAPRPKGIAILSLVPRICDRDVFNRDVRRRDPKAEPPADPWIDELQWLMGFPGQLGERR